MPISQETFTEITLVGTHNESQILMTAARQSGRLIWASAPRPVSPEDPRIQVTFRLTSTH